MSTFIEYDAERHEVFLKLFENEPEFKFHPVVSVFEHWWQLENSAYYVKDCVIQWLGSDATNNFFTKKDCFTAIGLNKTNEHFDKFWFFLTAPRSSDQYMVYHPDIKKWSYIP